MALGGGTFVAQNKKLAGTYVTFVSASRASSTFSDRGICALPLSLSWGETGKVIELTADDLLFKSRQLLGYDYDDPSLVSLREAFKHATKVLVYRLNEGATKATCTYCDAKFGGVRGNDLKIVITANVDQPSKFDVKTLLGTVEVDVQREVSNTKELVDNEFVVWKDSVTVELTASTPLTGGEDGTVQVGEWQKALGALEAETFNTLGIMSTEENVKTLAVAFTKRMRDEAGIKFQTVVYNHKADDKGIINLVSSPVGKLTADLIPWVTGLEAGCKVNASCTNKAYDGEFEVNVARKQSELEACVDNGEFVLHKVGDEVRVLTDINSKTTVSVEENDDFKSNQTIRVIDQVANDIAMVFNTRFLGIIPNDNAGRISLWNEIVKHHQQLQQLRAIENFVPENVVIARGDTKKSVVVSDVITPVNAMEQLYMSVTVA